MAERGDLDDAFKILHALDKRLTVVEIEVETCTHRTNANEAKFEKTFETMSQALVGIDNKLTSFIAKTDAVCETKEKTIGILLAIGIPLAGVIGWGFQKIFLH